jgi:hypothetical protein
LTFHEIFHGIPWKILWKIPWIHGTIFARVAYLHTSQICGRGVKVGIHGLLNWTAENLYLGNAISQNNQNQIVCVCSLGLKTAI